MAQGHLRVAGYNAGMDRSTPQTARALGLGLLCAVLLAGCVTQQGSRERPWPYPDPAASRPPPSAPSGTRPGEPIRDPETGQPVPIPPPGGAAPAEVIIVPPPAPNVPRSAEAISGQAVSSLVRQARGHRAAGQPQQAQAALERALRIEPRNYFVWSAMAQSYLDQKNYEQAESVAQKSNSLARGNAYVELENWKTIRAARAARGDSIGAQQAQARVEAIQQALGGS